MTEKYCKLLNTEPQAISNTKLLAFIDRWYGIPYLYAGHDRNGIDCSSFACALYNDVYRTNLSGTSGELYRACAHVKRDQLQQGDLVFFKIYHHRVSHVGVYVANGYFVHASTKAGVVLSNLSEDYYRKRYCGGGKPTAAR